MDRDNSNWRKWAEHIKWGRNWDVEEVERAEQRKEEQSKERVRRMDMNKPEH